MHSRRRSLAERRPSPAIRVAARPPVLVALTAALILLASAGALLMHEVPPARIAADASVLER